MTMLETQGDPDQPSFVLLISNGNPTLPAKSACVEASALAQKDIGVIVVGTGEEVDLPNLNCLGEVPDQTNTVEILHFPDGFNRSIASIFHDLGGEGSCTGFSTSP